VGEGRPGGSGDNLEKREQRSQAAGNRLSLQ